jgi:vacuolar-type H+-ATPase subunit E/Vma4
MTGWGSIESVIAAVREDARAEADRFDAEAAAAIARLREVDGRTPVTVPDGDVRLEVARRRARERDAEESWTDRQVGLEARERWLARVAAAGLDRLRAADAATRREDLLHLARDAAVRVGAPAVEVLVAPEDVSLTDAAWTAAVAAATGAHVTVKGDPTVTGGCIARTADGRLTCDNTFAARTRRFDAVWRHAVSELFETAS